MRAAKVQASLRIRAVSPEPSLLAHTSSESRGTFRQKARSLAPLNGWACAVKVCHDGMLEDTNSLGAAHLMIKKCQKCRYFYLYFDTDCILDKGSAVISLNFFTLTHIISRTRPVRRGVRRCNPPPPSAGQITPLAEQMFSKLCSFSPETDFTSLILASKPEFS